MSEKMNEGYKTSEKMLCDKKDTDISLIGIT